MTKIGDASIEVKLTKSRVVELLEEILATLKRIEAQGKPLTIEAGAVTVNAANGLTEDEVRKVANKELYWRIASSTGIKADQDIYSKVTPTEFSASRESVKQDIFAQPEAKEFMDDVISQVGNAPEGEAVKFGAGACGNCEGCGCG